jgi:hypothetical protein
LLFRLGQDGGPHAMWNSHAKGILQASFPELEHLSLLDMFACLLAHAEQLRSKSHPDDLAHVLEFFCGRASICKAGLLLKSAVRHRRPCKFHHTLQNQRSDCTIRRALGPTH